MDARKNSEMEPEIRGPQRVTTLKWGDLQQASSASENGETFYVEDALLETIFELYGTYLPDDKRERNDVYKSYYHKEECEAKCNKA